MVGARTLGARARPPWPDRGVSGGGGGRVFFFSFFFSFRFEGFSRKRRKRERELLGGSKKKSEEKKKVRFISYCYKLQVAPFEMGYFCFRILVIFDYSLRPMI